MKLLHQESELVTLLKRLPLGLAELAVIREKAELLSQGQLKRGEAVLPIMLATFIFDVLCPRNSVSPTKRQVVGKLCETTKEDEVLGFKTALYALGTMQFEAINEALVVPSMFHVPRLQYSGRLHFRKRSRDWV